MKQTSTELNYKAKENPAITGGGFIPICNTRQKLAKIHKILTLPITLHCRTELIYRTLYNDIINTHSLRAHGTFTGKYHIPSNF